jgi:Zn-finger nucleic acid-binding protein
MNCPSCGVPMHLKPDEGSYKCDFCHNVYVPDKNDEGVRVLEPSDESCPNCNITLMQAAIAKNRILYCTRCRGMLIPMEGFKSIIGELQLEQGGSISQPPADPGDLSRILNCPHCHQRMDTHLYAGGGNAVIESCEKCLHNWLDHGELARIIHAPDDTNPETIRDVGADLYEGPV